MIVADEIRKCVAYVGLVDNHDKKHLLGTCFFVYRTFQHLVTTYHGTWCVTARHVIEKIRATRDEMADHDGKMFLRLNKKTGGTHEYEMSAANDWSFHDTAAFDVAVSGITPDLVDYDHRAYPVDGFLTEELIERDYIGIGSELFFVGLFDQHAPESKNVPILRVGNIAAMPEELVQTQKGPAKLYLVESRSKRGLSGSPVFTYKKPYVTERDGKTILMTSPTRNALMGVIHGHYFEKSDDDESEVNVGIAMVTPIQAVQEILEYPYFEDRRLEWEADIRLKHPGGPTMD